MKLVEQMLALQKEPQSVRPEEDLDRARSRDKQIAQADAEIDRRVYVLSSKGDDNGGRGQGSGGRINC